jgi:hypothetical protein
MDGTSDGLGARPGSAEVLIAFISPIVLQASRADAAPSGTEHMAERCSMAGKCKLFDDVAADPAGTSPSSKGFQIGIEITVLGH